MCVYIYIVYLKAICRECSLPRREPGKRGWYPRLEEAQRESRGSGHLPWRAGTRTGWMLALFIIIIIIIIIFFIIIIILSQRRHSYKGLPNHYNR